MSETASSEVRVIQPRITLEMPGIKPTWYYRTWYEVDVDEIVKEGVEHVLIDLDGTLTPPYHHDHLDIQALLIIGRMHSRFKSINLATNNSEYVEFLREIYGFTHIFQPWDGEEWLPYKPSPRFYERILRDLGVEEPATVLMMGDSPFDDVEGAGALGMKTALIDCLDPHDFFGYRELINNMSGGPQ